MTKYFDEEDIITEYEKQLQKKDNEIKRLKEEYVILQNASDEVEEELQQRINKTIECIKDYLCSYDYTSAEYKDIANLFMGLLDTLQGVDKECK